MPTVVIFNDGVAVDKIIGFEGMGDRMPEGQEDSFPTIFLARFVPHHVAYCTSDCMVDDNDDESCCYYGNSITVMCIFMIGSNVLDAYEY